MADDKDSGAMLFIKNGVVIGGTAALASVAADMALRRTNYSYSAKGGLKAAAGALAALALANRVPRVAIGLMAFAVTAGVQGVTEEMRLQNYLARVGGGTRPAVNTLGAGAASSGSGTASGALPAGRYVEVEPGYRDLAGALRAVR